MQSRFSHFVITFLYDPKIGTREKEYLLLFKSGSLRLQKGERKNSRLNDAKFDLPSKFPST